MHGVKGTGKDRRYSSGKGDVLNGSGAGGTDLYE